MTFYSVLAASGEHANLVLALRIEGIPIAFVERTIPAAVASSLSGYTQFDGVTSIEEGESVLDMKERREVAATLDLEILDDSSGTLSSLFSVNARRLTWISADATASSTTLTLNSTSGLSNGQTIYTNEETVTIGTAGATLTGCTRGAFGSTAAALYAAVGGGDGDAIYTRPPNWVGRRASLYGYTLNSNGGGFEQLLGTYIIDDQPRHTGDKIWSVRLAGVAQEYYERAIGLNIQTALAKKDVVATYTAGTPGYFTIAVDNALAFRLGTNWDSYVLMRVEGSSSLDSIFKLQGVDTANSKISVYEAPEFGTSLSAAGDVIYIDTSPTNYGAAVRKANIADIIANNQSVTFKQIEMVGGTNRSMMRILLSKEGQLGPGGQYDNLPGRLPTKVYDAGWRMGAGFKTAEIDISAWEAIETSRPTMCVIDNEMPVSSVLKEWCLLNGMAVCVGSNGKLKPFTIASPRAGLATTIGPEHVIPGSRISVESDEASVYPLQTVKCNYSPLSMEYGSTINMVDQELAKRYGRHPRRIELEFRMIGCNDAPNPNGYNFPFDSGANVPISQMPMLATDIVRGENGLSLRYVSLSLNFGMMSLRIGDVVKLSGLPDAFSELPDLKGGTLNGAVGRIVSRRPGYNSGRIDVKIMLTEPLLHVCPTAIVSSNSGTTLTLSTTDDCSDSSPANGFFVGAGVALYDLGAGTRTTYTVTGLNIVGQTISINAAPAAAVGTRYVVLTPIGAGGPTSGTTGNGYLLSELAIIVDDDGVGTAYGEVNNQPRWR